MISKSSKIVCATLVFCLSLTGNLNNTQADDKTQSTLPPHLQHILDSKNGQRAQNILDFKSKRNLDSSFVELDPDTLILPPWIPPPPPGSGSDTTHPDDKYWAEGFGPQGGLANSAGCYILTLGKYKNKIYVGGFIQVAGSYHAKGVATWDGNSWSPLEPQINGDVYAYLLSDSKLIVGGAFQRAGNMSLNNIATWDGEQWENFGEGLNGFVSDIILYNNKIVACGRFTASGRTICRGVACWNGSKWEPLGEGLTGPGYLYVTSLAVYKGQLYAAGTFDSSGSTSVSKIAVWDGDNWNPLGSGLNASVYTLSVYDDKLIAAGSFEIAGGDSINRIAAWDGGNWMPLGGGTNATVMATTVHKNRLIAAGLFTKTDGVNMNYVSAWDGTSWYPIDTGVNRGAYSLLSTGDTLIVGGRFVVGKRVQFEYNVAFWDGYKWSAEFENSANAEVYTFMEYDNKLLAGGQFRAIGGVLADKVAAWDGRKWIGLGSDIQPQSWTFPHSVLDLEIYNGELIAGGYFDTISNVAAQNIAAWDGKSWRQLGNGTNVIATLIEFQGKLYAGTGYHPNGQMGGLVVWDGNQWSAFGQPVGGQYRKVYTMLVYENKLIVGGDFDSIGGIAANKIAAWDGHQWSTLNEGLTGIVFSGVDLSFVRDIIEYNGQLAVCGNFTKAGNISANNVAVWNGAEWQALGSGIQQNESAYSMAEHNGNLLVGGIFDSAGSVYANGIALWNGKSWSSLGSGLTDTLKLNNYTYHPYVYALASYQDELYVGGHFTMAGNKVSYHLAKWTKKESSIAPLPTSLSELPDELILKQNYPNPFNPVTTIEYDLHKSAHVILDIYNVLGQRVTKLVDEVQVAGSHVVDWNGQSDNGLSVASGVYFYKLVTDENVQTRKMLLLK